MLLFLAAAMAFAGPDSLSGPPPSSIQPPQPHPTYRDEPKSTVTVELPTKARMLNRNEVFNQDNYPFWAKGTGEEGTVRVAVEISATGAATACEVTGSSGSASLDIGTCDLITERVRFSPARDLHGRPVADPRHALSITWQLIQDAPYPIKDDFVRIVYSVDKSLQVANCRIEKSEPDMEFDPRSCAQFRPAAQLMVAVSPDEFEWDDWEVVLDTSYFAGAGDHYFAVGKAKNQMLFDRDITRVTIGPEGRIKKCEDIEKSKNTPFIDKAAWCAKSMGTDVFEAAKDGADRLFSFATAIYLRRKPTKA